MTVSEPCATAEADDTSATPRKTSRLMTRIEPPKAMIAPLPFGRGSLAVGRLDTSARATVGQRAFSIPQLWRLRTHVPAGGHRHRRAIARRSAGQPAAPAR